MKKQSWNSTIFRKNDIRGIYKQDFDLGFVQQLAFAFVAFCQQKPENAHNAISKKLVVAVGHDARLSSPEITKYLIESLKQAGADICFLGLVPSPLCFFASYFVKEISASMIVTASHNPPAFNGFKMMVNKETVCDEQILELQNLLQKGNFSKHITKGITRSFDIESTYIAFMKKRFSPGRGDKGRGGVLSNKPLPQASKSRCSYQYPRVGGDAPPFSQISVVVDCGNGASGPLAQKMFKALANNDDSVSITFEEIDNGIRLETQNMVSGALSVRVHWLYARPDGHFPHHHPDPSLEENLQDLQTSVQKTKSHFGVAFDGDGDRLVVVSKNGRILQGDELMSIFISDILYHSDWKRKNLQASLNQTAPVSATESVGQAGPAPRAEPVGQTLPALRGSNKISIPIVADVKCGDWFFDFLRKNQVQALMWKSGHSLIRQKTIEQKAVFGGELSGHFFFNDDTYPIDDGLYGLLRLIEISCKTKKSLEELVASKNTVETPEIRYPVQDETIAKKKIENLKTFYKPQAGACCIFIDGVRVSFPGRAWGLARFSNTQKEWTFRFGGKNQQELDKIQADFYRLLNLPTGRREQRAIK